MKKILSAMLALAMILSLVPAAFAAGGMAYASTQAVEVDGKKIEFQMYALKDANGNGTNYVKLRDVAHVLNGTSVQFSVGYDNAIQAISVTTGQPYTDLGSEMYTPFSGDRAYAPAGNSVLVNGQPASLDAISLTDDNGGGYTYFKLRDLGAALGFKVDWTPERGVIVETGGSAQTTTPTQPTQPASPLDLLQGAWKGRFTVKDGRVIDEEFIITGDQFEMLQKVVSTTKLMMFKGTVSIQENVVDSSNGVNYPYLLTFKIKEGMNYKTGAMEPYEHDSNYYIKSVDPNAGIITWVYDNMEPYSRMNLTDPSTLYVASQNLLNKTGGNSDSDYNKMIDCYNKTVSPWNSGKVYVLDISLKTVAAEMARSNIEMSSHFSDASALLDRIEAQKAQSRAIRDIKTSIDRLIRCAEEILSACKEYPNIFPEAIAATEALIRDANTLRTYSLTEKSHYDFADKNIVEAWPKILDAKQLGLARIKGEG